MSKRFRAGVVVTTLSLLLAVFATGHTFGQTPAGRSALYVTAGPELAWYEVDVEQGTLTRRGSVALPANVHEASPDPSRRFLYVGWSSSANPAAPSGGPGNNNGLSAFQIDRVSGALRPHGQPASLPTRPIHVTVDRRGAHVLAAFNNPSGVAVYRIQPDGSIGTLVTPPSALDTGVYAHQIRVEPSNTTAILVTRGNGPTESSPEDPGALKIYAYDNGVLTNRASIAPGRGFNFQPRHVDFHPSQPWVYVTLERQNKLQVYVRERNGSLGSEAAFTVDTLADPRNIRPGQALGTVHMHPSGRWVYVANRASGTTEVDGKRVFVGGENTIAVYRINQSTGEPVLVQQADTRGIHPRTFALDASGRILVAANLMSVPVRQGDRIVSSTPSLAVFRVGPEGRLDFVRTYDLTADPDKTPFWMGIVPLP